MEAVVVRLTLLIVLWCMPRLLDAQVALHPISDADALQADTPRPMVILVSAPWCKWCAQFKAQTLKDPRLTALGESFYFFELNDEDKQPITFFAQSYDSMSGDHHQLSVALFGEAPVSLPGIFVMNERGVIVFANSGFMTAEELNAALISMQ